MQRLQGAIAIAIVGAWRWWAALALVAVYAPAYAATRWHWNALLRPTSESDGLEAVCIVC